MKLSEAISNFITDRKLRYMTEKTIVNYRDVLKAFIAYVGDLDIESISFDTVKSYNAYLVDKKLSRASVATYLRHIKAFFNYLENEGYIPEGTIAKRIKLPKTPKKNINLFSGDDMKLIFESVSEESDWLEARDRLMIALMYDSGLRQAELCNINRVDIDTEKKILLVHGKGSKDRFVPMGYTTSEFLNEYITACPYETDYLLCSRRGERLTVNAVKKMMAKLRERTELNGLSSHKLRHNFATNWCIDGYMTDGYVDNVKLATLMGHESLSTTERYMHEANSIISTTNFRSHLDSIS